MDGALGGSDVDELLELVQSALEVVQSVQDGGLGELAQRVLRLHPHRHIQQLQSEF